MASFREWCCCPWISGIITLDENRCVTFLNPYSENVFRIQQKEALGKHYREVFGRLPSWLQVIDEFLQAREEKQSLEHHLVFPDGKAIFLETHFSKIRLDDQSHIIDLLFLRDITARKRMEEHIRRSDRLISDRCRYQSEGSSRRSVRMQNNCCWTTAGREMSGNCGMSWRESASCMTMKYCGKCIFQRN